MLSRERCGNRLRVRALPRPSGRTPAGKGNGAGWGGAAKGAGFEPREQFETGNDAGVGKGRPYPTSPNYPPEWWAEQANKAAITAELHNKYLGITRGVAVGIAGDVTVDHVIKAAEKLDFAINGQPGASLKIGGDGKEPVRIEDTRRPVTELLQRALADAAAKDEA